MLSRPLLLLRPVPRLVSRLTRECACVSVHGANRLGTNSLLDIVVFGKRGGAHMTRFAADSAQPPLPERPAEATMDLLDGILTRTEGDNAADIRAELQDQMFDLAFVVRSEDGLRKMQGILGGLRERYADGTQAEIELPPSPPGTFYLLRMDATRDRHRVGYLTLHGQNYLAWDYRFLVDVE